MYRKVWGSLKLAEPIYAIVLSTSKIELSKVRI
jgi:hypothetical protein